MATKCGRMRLAQLRHASLSLSANSSTLAALGPCTRCFVCAHVRVRAEVLSAVMSTASDRGRSCERIAQHALPIGPHIAVSLSSTRDGALTSHSPCDVGNVTGRMDDAAFQHAAAVALALNTRAARVSEKQQLAQLNQSLLHLGNAAGPQQREASQFLQ
jgi:hypothetical protein